MLSERRKKILKALVDEYRATGEPVGSAVLTKKSRLGLSSATLRHELSELDDQGYLQHPHASAGRVPTEEGLRFYARELQEDRSVKEEDRRRIQESSLKGSGDMERLIRSAIHGLTDITGYIGIGMLPRISESHLHRLELIPLPGNRVLAVMVTDSGLVRSKMIELTETVVEDEMRRISEFLEEAYRDVTFHEIGESFLSILERSKERTRDLLREAMTISRKCFNESCAGELFFEGLPDMMRHNFLNREAAGDLLDLMSDSTRLPEYLSDQMVPEQMRILVGSEIPYPALQHMGMVLGTYEFNGHPSGTLGIIGPMQMDYGRVEGLVRYTAEEVSKKLKKKERSAKSS